MLKQGQTSAIFYNNSGSFSAKDFGANAMILQRYVVNLGVSDVTFFNGQYTLASKQASPVFSMQTGYQDTGTYFFTFDDKGSNALVVIASIANAA